MKSYPQHRKVFLLLLALAALSPATTPAASGAWEKIVLTNVYFCDGINAADLNRDSKLDIIAGPIWYQGPDFAIRHEFYPAKALDPAASPSDSMFSYSADFNSDGWLDILVLGRVHLHQAFWYENPKTNGGHWRKHFAFHRVQGESPPFLDVDGDNRPELVAHWEKQWGLIQPNWDQPEKPWQFKPLTEKGEWHHFYHGTGVGDLNGDGRLDILLNDGWFEHPAGNTSNWLFHPFKFAPKGGAQMFATDVNGDSQADVITALDAHGWGLSWFEVKKRGGALQFENRLIMGDRSQEAALGAAFTQPHALAMADIDGDGLTDIITGKRRWAHGPAGDIEPNAAPVVYWFKLMREGGVRFIPRMIDAESGVGVQIAVADVNGDKRPDVLTASKLGSFVFLNKGGHN